MRLRWLLVLRCAFALPLGDEQPAALVQAPAPQEAAPLCPVPTSAGQAICDWSTDDRQLALNLKHRLLTSVAAATHGKRLLLSNTLAHELVHVETTPEILDAGYSLERAWTDGPGRSAPLLMYVHGTPATAYPNSSCVALEALSREPDVPVVLVTLGWDSHADPLSVGLSDMDTEEYYLQVACARDLLALPQVIMWVVSHSQDERSNVRSDKYRFVPIGFGADAFLSRTNHFKSLSEETIIGMVAEASRRFSPDTSDGAVPWDGMGAAPPQRLVYAPFSTLERANGSAGAIPGLQAAGEHGEVNTTEYMCEALRTVIGLSPPGTRPDCFRHYELLTAGDIVVTTEHPNGTHSLHTILADLPVVYVSEVGGWGGLSCSWLLAQVRRFQTWERFAHEKLTVEYWRDYVKNESMVAFTRHQQAKLASDLERSMNNRPV